MTATAYTTQLQAGLGMIEETRSLLAIWQPGMDPPKLYQAALASGRFPQMSARRLRNVVVECFAPRFLREDGAPAILLQTLLLKADFDEILERIRQGRDLGHASCEPIYYLVFPPRHILEVKRSLPAWTAKLRNGGWKVHCFSVASEIADILTASPLQKTWLTADRKSPLTWQKTNDALTNRLAGGPFKDRLEALLDRVRDEPNAIVLVTDLEALHPYLRIGAIEGQLEGKFHIPTVFFYPGERTGKTRLKFLGFYPDDGNYRSTHVGG